MEILPLIPPQRLTTDIRSGNLKEKFPSTCGSLVTETLKEILGINRLS